MSWDAAYVETRSTRRLPQRAAATVAAWEADGWELVGDLPHGLLRELYFQRVTHPAGGAHARSAPGPRRLALAVTAATVTLGAVVVAAVAAGGDDAGGPTAAGGSPSTPSEDPSVDPSAASAALTSSGPGLATVLAVTDPCSGTVAAFAEAAAGSTVELDATVAATRAAGPTTYDVLLRAGDAGPDLGFQGVTVADLHLDPAGGRDYVSTGDDLAVTARVGAFVPDACVLLLEPVTTEIR